MGFDDVWVWISWVEGVKPRGARSRLSNESKKLGALHRDVQKAVRFFEERLREKLCLAPPRRDHMACARFSVLVALGHKVDHKLSSHP